MPPKKKPEPPQQTQILEQTEHAPVVPTTQLVAPLQIQEPPSPEVLEKMAADRIRTRKAYVRLVAQELRPQDVLVFGEEVYIPNKPCQDILSWAGIRVTPVGGGLEEHRYPSPDGDFIVFEIRVRLTDGSGREVEVIGNRSTRDEFFGIAGKEYLCPQCKGPLTRRKVNPDDKWESSFCAVHGRVKPEKVVHFLALHDVDIASVRKAAIANMWNHALKAIGLCPTLQDLADAGMNTSLVKRVAFNGQKADAPRQASPPKQAATPHTTAPATQAPAAAKPPNGPPRASIPTPDQAAPIKVFGGIQKVLQKKKKNGQDYRQVITNNVTYYLFRNMTRPIDTKGATRTMFEILDAALQGDPGEFLIKVSQGPNGEPYPNIENVLRVGLLEWDETGILVLRREKPEQESFGAAFTARDDDVGF